MSGSRFPVIALDPDRRQLQGLTPIAARLAMTLRADRRATGRCAAAWLISIAPCTRVLRPSAAREPAAFHTYGPPALAAVASSLTASDAAAAELNSSTSASRRELPAAALLPSIVDRQAAGSIGLGGNPRPQWVC